MKVWVGRGLLCMAHDILLQLFWWCPCHIFRMELVYLVLELPQSLSKFPTSLNVEKSLLWNKVLMPWPIMLLPNHLVCHDALNISIIGDLCSYWLLFGLVSIWNLLILMERLKHTNMEHWMNLKLCWQLKFVGHLAYVLQNSERSLISSHKPHVHSVAQNQMQFCKD